MSGMESCKAMKLDSRIRSCPLQARSIWIWVLHQALTISNQTMLSVLRVIQTSSLRAISKHCRNEAKMQPKPPIWDPNSLEISLLSWVEAFWGAKDAPSSLTSVPLTPFWGYVSRLEGLFAWHALRKMDKTFSWWQRSRFFLLIVEFGYMAEQVMLYCRILLRGLPIRVACSFVCGWRCVGEAHLLRDENLRTCFWQSVT